MSQNPNSALRWLPPLEAARLPVPRTHFIPYEHGAIVSVFDGEFAAEFERLEKAVAAYVEEVGAPCFLRTDLGSAKHSGPGAFLLKPGANIGQVLLNLLEDQEIKFWLERHGPAALMIREYLPLDSTFTAFRGLPVNREFRFFASGSEVFCSHPYWPEDALEGHVNEVAFPGWRAQLRTLQQIDDSERDYLTQLAILAAGVQHGGEWSVDFARDVNGKWWLIDCATAADSYHWHGCGDETRFKSR